MRSKIKIQAAKIKLFRGVARVKRLNRIRNEEIRRNTQPITNAKENRIRATKKNR